MTPSSCMNATRRLPAGVLHEADGIDGQAGLGQPVPQGRGDDRVGGDGRGGAPQQDGVAGLEAQAGGVAGDVRAVLVDDADHPERDADPLDPEAVGADPALDDLPHRVGQAATSRRPSAMAATRPASSRRRSSDVASAAGGRGPVHIDGVGLQDGIAAALDQVGRDPQGVVPGGRRRGGQHTRRRLGPATQVDQRGGGVRGHGASVVGHPTGSAQPPAGAGGGDGSTVPPLNWEHIGVRSARRPVGGRRPLRWR